ncbi:HRDC domain-containing protein [Corynebacterium pseudopelargi]|uniref:Ribonuclease D n=1 Tax=Corynebacterium pseudopelargi TaxID=2080757 RepID=A0A3G6IYS8_9CORY|nr:HRDC domain-containing protein [Corynebacterium pseudopelargi]AZA09134.1 Ribonuclease D [Corynebacterium pseudopelargi]
MVTTLSTPRDGLPALCTTPSQLRKAERTLAKGTGAIAVDTERAGGIRYNDRAFLLQLRRAGSGTVLIDPEPHREVVGPALEPALSQTTWVLHDAATDLPSLYALGLYPADIFDTAVAAKLLNITPYRLPELSAALIGYTMHKSHGGEDWSRRPLPKAWRNYAALDVEVLLELAQACQKRLDAAGKSQWAKEEFEFIQHKATPLAPPRWEDSKAANSVSKPQELAVIRALWHHRDALAMAMDVAPHRLLPDKAMVAIATKRPRSVSQLMRLSAFPRDLRGHAGEWLNVAQAGIAAQPWPKRPRRQSTISASAWKKRDPSGFERLLAAETALEQVQADINVEADTLMSRRTLRKVCWACIHQGEELEQALDQTLLRPWQREQAQPVFRAAGLC